MSIFFASMLFLKITRQWTAEIDLEIGAELAKMPKALGETGVFRMRQAGCRFLLQTKTNPL